jgi:putative tryptophan/tyrosine transport system substrate-binding protein
MRRREFIAGLACAAWPGVASAQPLSLPVVGFLHPESLEKRREHVAAFHGGLAQFGYFEGRNIAIEYRWADGRNDRLPALAADLVRRQVAVIAGPANATSALAVKAATRTIPIVFLTGADPVHIGLVTSLNRPGGNLTGVSLLNVGIAAKRLELLHELAPAEKLIGFLANPTNTAFATTEARELEEAAHILGVRTLTLNASSDDEIEAAFETLVRQQLSALVVGGDPFFVSQRDQIAELAIRHRMPMISQYRENTLAGGLMSYGSNLLDAYRLVGTYTGRILNGEKPADLPVQQSTKIELVINLKTAKALGISFPQTLLARADEVIE